MRIAELEQRTGVSRHTLRYYEKEGLLLEVGRRGNNYRDYSEKAVQRVGMVRQLKALGFSLKEIREVLDALRSDSIDCDQGAALMAEKKAAVDRKITELKAVSRMLGEEQKRLLASAEAQRRSQACAG
ncbi:MerR family transcriptional regulator [Alcanivorax sp. HI0083]|uniref:MerR family transcriptional regulator n=1 Tax=unclassified Alcanivorax TaxID=2638842 RepID=UPI0007BA0F94|nr:MULTISPECIES: MerR family transcriptional regulator [unclassified Alcanivorax]KZY39576.1 MerR family transcriptional regulator [Alcanivorax sp. HI0044]KZZ26985.1 MerR family transcriptional regulator [Alcanivorax sp. HI0083]